MKYKDYLGKEAVKDIKEKLEQALDSEAGFIFIYNGDKHRCTDSYFRVCAHDVLNVVEKMVEDADEHDLLPKSSN